MWWAIVEVVEVWVWRVGAGGEGGGCAEDPGSILRGGALGTFPEDMRDPEFPGPLLLSPWPFNFALNATTSRPPRGPFPKSPDPETRDPGTGPGVPGTGPGVLGLKIYHRTCEQRIG